MKMSANGLALVAATVGAGGRRVGDSQSLARRAASGGFAAALALACVVGGAMAHDAGDGWQYPYECCSGIDCRRVSVDDLRENADGSWTYLPLNITFSKDKVRPSGNRWFHVCYTPSTLKPLCIFILSGV